ncbi:FKBP-type peptidyl-prolyl cis-trans isomerase [Bacteroidota bacterium]
MKKNVGKNILLLMMMILLFACKQNDKNERAGNQEETKESLIKMNQILIEKDRQSIEAYVKRKELKMNMSESGLWIAILNKGNGEKAQRGKIAKINYKISLIDGTICYDSDNNGPKTFIIGSGGVEKGLEEGILLLREGDKARFIMPPYLAHGILGDDNRIPSRAIIIYDVELLDVYKY